MEIGARGVYWIAVYTSEMCNQMVIVSFER